MMTYGKGVDTMSKSLDICRRVKNAARRIREDSALRYIKNPLFTMSSNREFIAQGNITVEKYEDTEVILMIGQLSITALGRGLTLCFYNKYTAKLQGYITSVNFDEYAGGKH